MSDDASKPFDTDLVGDLLDDPVRPKAVEPAAPPGRATFARVRLKTTRRAAPSSVARLPDATPPRPPSLPAEPVHIPPPERSKTDAFPTSGLSGGAPTPSWPPRAPGARTGGSPEPSWPADEEPTEMELPRAQLPKPAVPSAKAPAPSWPSRGFGAAGDPALAALPGALTAPAGMPAASPASPLSGGAPTPSWPPRAPTVDAAPPPAAPGFQRRDDDPLSSCATMPVAQPELFDPPSTELEIKTLNPTPEQAASAAPMRLPDEFLTVQPALPPTPSAPPPALTTEPPRVRLPDRSRVVPPAIEDGSLPPPLIELTPEPSPPPPVVAATPVADKPVITPATPDDDEPGRPRRPVPSRGLKILRRKK